MTNSGLSAWSIRKARTRSCQSSPNCFEFVGTCAAADGFGHDVAHLRRKGLERGVEADGNGFAGIAAAERECAVDFACTKGQEVAAGKASGWAYAAKAGFGCRAGKELDDGSGNAGRAFVTLALHKASMSPRCGSSAP